MDNKKKITLLVSSLRGGGAERVCVNVANILISKGWEVNLVVLNLNNLTFFSQLSKKVNLVKLNVSRVRFSGLAVLKYVFKNKPEIFLVFNYELSVILILLRSFFKLKFKVISRNINTISEKLEQLKNENFWKKNVLKKLINKYYFNADYIINQCHGMYTDLIKVSPKNYNNSSVIYNPISDEILDYLSSNDLNKIEKKNYLLCVGRLEKQKAFHYAIKGFAGIAEEFPNLRLKILGEGSLEDSLRQYSKELGLQNRIDFEGFQKNIIPYYLSAKGTMITSIYEGFPNCLIESIKLGTPVISFDCPNGPRELIEENVNGYLVKYKDINDLKYKLLKLMSKKFSIDKMNLTLKRHEPDEVAKNYDKLLSSFLKN